MTKFLFRKCIQKSSKKIFAFIIDFGTVTIKFNGNFKNNHLQAIIEKIWFEGDFIWLDNGYNLIG